MFQLVTFLQFQVTLKVKVTNISEVTKQTIRSGQQLDKCVATLSDHSGSIPYTIWDKDLGRISLLKCYTICDASVRSFNGKALTTCPTTTIVEIADIGIVKHTEEEKDIQEHNISILSVLCTDISHCPICRKDVGEYNKDIPTIKCQNCKMRQRTSNILPSYKCEIITKINGETKKLYISNTAIKNFPPTNTCITCDQI